MLSNIYCVYMCICNTYIVYNITHGLHNVYIIYIHNILIKLFYYFYYFFQKKQSCLPPGESVSCLLTSVNIVGNWFSAPPPPPPLKRLRQACQDSWPSAPGPLITASQVHIRLRDDIHRVVPLPWVLCVLSLAILPVVARIQAAHLTLSLRNLIWRFAQYPQQQSCFSFRVYPLKHFTSSCSHALSFSAF